MSKEQDLERRIAELEREAKERQPFPPGTFGKRSVYEPTDAEKAAAAAERARRVALVRLIRDRGRIGRRGRR